LELQAEVNQKNWHLQRVNVHGQLIIHLSTDSWRGNLHLDTACNNPHRDQKL